MNMSGINIEKIDDDNVCFSFANGSLNVLIRNGDLSREPCDAIVNTTNSSLVPHGGLDAHIHQTMGQYFTDQVVAIHKDMQDRSCPDGQSRIFIAKFNRAEEEPRFIISTVGPIYEESNKERAAFLLQSCYYTSLALANIYQLTSIGYPAISCGTNQYPPHEAARIAIDSIRRFSFNVKDVRFVFYDRAIYDIFLEEWTYYADEVNLETNYVDYNSKNSDEPCKSSKSKHPVLIKPKTNSCVLCREQPLSSDIKLLCHACSSRPRAEIFKHILTNLREAGDQSYDSLVKECELLEPTLALYKLIYVPAETYDLAIHNRDHIAEHYIHQYCDKFFRNFIPIVIAGDGNCFYNSFVELGGRNATVDGSPLTSVELRARNVIELVLHAEAYKDQYSGLSAILDKFEDYVRKEMVHDTNFVGILDLLSIPTVLNIDLQCSYPKVNGKDDLTAEYLDKQFFIPLSHNDTTNDNESTSRVSLQRNTVRLLFSHSHRPIKYQKEQPMWTPNHFVPLLKIR